MMKRLRIFIILSLFLLFMTGCSSSAVTTDDPTGEVAAPTEEETAQVVEATTVTGTLEVHYIDVGQADAILVEQGDHAMLIDAGNNADTDLVTSYLPGQGIASLDVLVGTHPHEDHIGSLDAVINQFDIGEIYMPELTATTQTFEDVITAITNKGMSISSPTVGTQFNLGEAVCTILGPLGSEGDDANTYSIVIKVEYGNNSFLFTGDAETVNESAMIAAGEDLSADVLKVGHHGSSSSSSQAFVDAVNPTYAIISVGPAPNEYGHPTSATLDRLYSNAIQVFRTDLQGTIIATSDGQTISFNVTPIEQANSPPGDSTDTASTETVTSAASTTATEQTVTADQSTVVADNSETVYITETGSKYHAAGCQYLSNSCIAISKADANSQGFTPCSKCNP